MNDKVRQLLSKNQVSINNEFNELRKQFEHSGNKGTNGEFLIRELIRNFLSPIHRLGYGEVIDSTGETSKQIDVVITNQCHPFLNNYDKPSMFYIEGVSCCGESKFILTSEELKISLDNCLAFKKLSPKIDDTMICNAADMEDVLRFVDKRPYFLLCYESQLTIDTVLQKVKEYNNSHNSDIKKQIDAIFLLDRGYIINLGKGKGNSNSCVPNGVDATGYISVPIGNDNEIIVALMRWLSCTILSYSTQIPIIRHYLW